MHVIMRTLSLAIILIGFDTTSRVFDIGRGVSLKLLRNSDDFNLHAEVFSNGFTTAEEIGICSGISQIGPSEKGTLY